MNKYLAIFGKPRYLGIVPYEDSETTKLEPGGTIIAESYRGEELAIVAGELTEAQEKKYRQLKNATESGDGIKTSEPVVTDLVFLKFATERDLELEPEFMEEEKKIFEQAKELLKPHNLDMKLIDVEFLRKRKKLFFYFSSEQRVDFRAYVRDLAREFKTRIELRQIGVRDEAKIIRGISPCGQRCCCSYWLNQFVPINIRMVKEQNLALNPSKISGICGRLMCCMHYENNVYRAMWAGLPNPGSKIKTPNGNIIIAGMDLTSGSVRCMIPGRGEIKVSVAQFEEFKRTVLEGKEWNVEEEMPLRDGDTAVETRRFSPRLKPDSTATGEPREEKPSQPRRAPRREHRETASGTAAPQVEQQQKKKRRKRNHGGAARQTDGQQAAVRPEKQQPEPGGGGTAPSSGRPRRPQSRGRRKSKNSGGQSTVEREGGN